MVFASAVLMLAGSPQTFLGIANAQESLFPLEILEVYGRHASNELEQTLAQIWRLATSPPTNDAELGNGSYRFSIAGRPIEG